MKRLRSSLILKIFILTLFLLLAISGITYASVAVFLPKTYRNSLEKDLAAVSESLKTELESYASIEEAKNFLELFERNNEASVTVLDKEGNQVFPQVETTVEDTMTTGSEESTAVESAVEEDGLVTFSGIAVSDEDVEELGDDTYGVTVSDAGYFTLSTSYPSAVKSYEITVGGKEYTLLVVGDMEAVSQAAEIVKRIFPMVLGITLLIAFFCAILASRYLVRPILRLSRVSRKMAALDFSEHCEEKRKDEIGALAENLNELSDSLSTALSDLRSANEELKLFFAAASHELKTPVTILKGHLGGMLEGVGEYQDYDRYLRRSYQVTETLETMVKEILTISCMGTGVWKTERKKTDLAELFRQETAEVWELLEEKEMELIGEIPEHVYVLADSEGLKKVFRNFLTNAIRYSPKGAKLTVCFPENGFSLENEGTSIPEKALPKLFEAFYRVEDSRNRKSGGSGLGLYIVRMILEAHGAAYGAENTAGGVRFWFRLEENHTQFTHTLPETTIKTR